MGYKPTLKELVSAGVHFGHLTHKWSPKMHEYIFTKSNGIHLIDLKKTLVNLDKVEFSLKNIVRSGRKILFVATKKQAKEIVKTQAINLGMPYVTERWLGGMLTNFSTIRKSLKKLTRIENQIKEEDFESMAKRERLMIVRDKKKLEKLLGGIVNLQRLPAALFVVDIKWEHIAVKEAKKMNIPVFAMVDTNSDPTAIDFPIPSNDDAFKSIFVIMEYIGKIVQEGLLEYQKKKKQTSQKVEGKKERVPNSTVTK